MHNFGCYWRDWSPFRLSAALAAFLFLFLSHFVGQPSERCHKSLVCLWLIRETNVASFHQSTTVFPSSFASLPVLGQSIIDISKPFLGHSKVSFRCWLFQS